MNRTVRVLVTVDDGEGEPLRVIIVVPEERVGGLDRWLDRLMRNRQIRGMRALDVLPDFQRIEESASI